MQLPSLRKGALIAALSVTAAAGLAACAETSGPGYYGPYEAGVAARVEQGEVVAFRPVTIGGRASGAGTALGAVVGAVAGSQFGGGRSGHTAGAVVGGVGGAIAGNAIEKNANTRQGFAYTVRLRRTGETIEVAQADAYPIPVGSRVNVSYGDVVRITPLGGYAPPPPPPPGYR